MNIVIIGQGNVATNLDYAFRKKGVACQMVSSREGLDRLPAANVYIYAVRDEALPSVVAQVVGVEKSLHLHTSGTMPITVFGEGKPPMKPIWGCPAALCRMVHSSLTLPMMPVLLSL